MNDLRAGCCKSTCGKVGEEAKVSFRCNLPNDVGVAFRNRSPCSFAEAAS